MLDLETYDGILVWRGKYARFDRAIVDEVKIAYFQEIAPVETAQHVLDIGAHIGSWSVWVKRHNPFAKIIAVEANPENVAICRMNLVNYPDVKVLHRRAGYTELNEPAMLVNDYNSGGHWILEKAQAEEYVRTGLPGVLSVVDAPALISLEELMQDMERCNILKMDCEGSEFDILENASDTVLQRIDAIVGEFHEPLSRFEEKIANRLSQWFHAAVIEELMVGLGNFAFVRK